MARSILKTADSISFGVLLLGAINSSVAEITGANITKVTAKRSKPAVQAFYVGLAVAAVYQFARVIGPKTKSEQRIQHITQLYDQADSYSRRARIYRQAAGTFLRRRASDLKSLRD